MQDPANWPNARQSAEMLVQTRRLIARGVEAMSDEQLLRVPPGHRNNIAWNLGHLITTQQRLHYGLCGLDLCIPAEWIVAFKPGTTPSDWSDPPDLDGLRRSLLDTAERLVADTKARLFRHYETYTTSTGVVLPTLVQADAFNHFHEGVHTGIILRMRKALS